MTFNAMLAVIYVAITVGAGELVVMVIGYIIFILLRKSNRFYKMIDTTQNMDFKF